MTSVIPQLVQRVVPFKITDEMEGILMAISSVVLTTYGTHFTETPLLYQGFVATVGMGMAGLFAALVVGYTHEGTDSQWTFPILIGSTVALIVNMMVLILLA